MTYRPEARTSTALRALMGASVLACSTTDQPTSAIAPGLAAGPERGLEAGEEPTSSERARARMVEVQLRSRGLQDERVLSVMRSVPRHEFVPEDVRGLAYDDRPLPIGYEQTISQPYVVALMTSLLELEPTDRVLEVGTGSGYQAAVLGKLVAEVYSIEIVEPLAVRATRDLARLGFPNVHVRHGDGYEGWPEHAPYDAIVVTAAPPRVPEPLKEQLAVGGHLVLPVGERLQQLRVITRGAQGFTERSIIPVAFVPMTGRAQDDPIRE